MSTRARVALRVKENEVISSYIHNDGYPLGLGKLLKDNYMNFDKIKKSIELGDASSWDKEIGSQNDFYNKKEGINVYYNRDRGDSWEDVKPLIGTFKETYQYFYQSAEQYLYYFSFDGNGEFKFSIIERDKKRKRK